MIFKNDEKDLNKKWSVEIKKMILKIKVNDP